MQPGVPATIGQYRVLGPLGEGGAGYVVLAEHMEIGRRVAIKLLRENLNDEASVRRFVDEARAVNRFRHPQVVEVYDIGRDDDGRPYLVMELLEGETLRARMSRERRIPVPDAVALVAAIARVLETAHESRIVHRDLKPENVFLPRDGSFKVLDFGIAKLFDQATSSKTGGVIGTPLYMSPEQCQDAKSVDRRSDVYSLGVMLFEMLTGQPPFIGSLMEVIVAHVAGKPPVPSTLRPGIPGPLDRAVLRALEKDRAARPATAAAFAEELEAALDDSPHVALQSTLAAPPPSVAPAAPGKAPTPGAEGATLQARFESSWTGHGALRQLLRNDPSVLTWRADGGGEGSIVRWMTPALVERVGLPAARRAIEQAAAVRHATLVAPTAIVEHLGGLVVVRPFVPATDASVPARCLVEPRMAARALSHLAEGLATAHEHGLAHGHLGPHDVFIDGALNVRLVDLGLSVQRFMAAPAPADDLRALGEYACDLLGAMPGELAARLGQAGAWLDAASRGTPPGRARDLLATLARPEAMPVAAPTTPSQVVVVSQGRSGVSIAILVGVLAIVGLIGWAGVQRILGVLRAVP